MLFSDALEKPFLSRTLARSIATQSSISTFDNLFPGLIYFMVGCITLEWLRIWTLSGNSFFVPVDLPEFSIRFPKVRFCQYVWLSCWNGAVFPPDSPFERPPHPSPFPSWIRFSTFPSSLDKIPHGLLPPTISHQQSNFFQFLLVYEIWRTSILLSCSLVPKQVVASSHPLSMRTQFPAFSPSCPL